MTDTTLPAEIDPPANPEDYTGSVSWLLPKGAYTIVDIDDIPLMEAHGWRMALVSGKLTARVVRKTGRSGGHIYLHRELMDFPDKSVDHINRDSTDNRRRNLRACTHWENVLNAARIIDVPVRYKGVNWMPELKKWMVRFCSDGNDQYLGVFADPIAAARVYNAASTARFGPEAFQNPV